MIEIHKAALHDVELINNLALAAFTATYCDLLSTEQLHYMLEMMYSPLSITHQIEELNHQYFIAYNNDEPLGYIDIVEHDNNAFLLDKIYLLPQSKGQGFGQKLFEFVCDHVASMSSGSSCRLELNVNRGNVRAIEFYQKMGMSISHTRDHDIGGGFYMNDYIMAIEITKQ